MKGWFRNRESRENSGDAMSKQAVTIKHEPMRFHQLRYPIALLFVCTAAVCFYLGVGISGRNLEILRTEITETKAVNAEQLDELENLRNQTAMLERNVWINQRAAEEMRLEFIRMREEKSIMTRELRFYRGIMDPARAGDGVAIQTFELLPTSEPGRFQWKLVVTQNSSLYPLQRGQLKINITGSDGEKRVTYPLDKLSKDIISAQKLGFRYFQSFPGNGLWGVLDLPKGFEPDALEISIQLTSPARKQIKKTVEWFVEESEQ